MENEGTLNNNIKNFFFFICITYVHICIKFNNIPEDVHTIIIYA